MPLPGRMDKTMDEMWKTNRRFQHYRPQLCPHFTHNQFVLITIISFNFFLFFDSIWVTSIMSQRLVPSVTFLNESTR